jgi:hypothetical protein
MNICCDKVYIGIIYGKIINAKTFRQLKRLASIEANKRYNSIDELYIISPKQLLICRYNRVMPNNIIKRGQW